MIVTLAEMKQYLRVDGSDDDALITYLIKDCKKRCLDILRVDDVSEVEDRAKLKLGVYYAVAYLYEHREEADHNKLNLTLRAILFADRKAGF